MREGEFGKGGWGEPVEFGKIVTGNRGAGDRGGGKDEQDDGLPWLGQDAEDWTEFDDEPGFFGDLPDRGGFDGFTALDESRWKAPGAGGSRPCRAFAEQDMAVPFDHDRDRDLGIEPSDRTATGADRA